MLDVTWNPSIYLAFKRTSGIGEISAYYLVRSISYIREGLWSGEGASMPVQAECDEVIASRWMLVDWSPVEIQLDAYF